MSKYRILPIPLQGGMPIGTLYGASVSVTLDEDYILGVQLLDQNGDALGAEATVDLPLEAMIVSGTYDSLTKSIVLTLDNGQTITIPVADLVSGLQTEITSQNPLSADLLTDGNTNKVFTATEQTKLSNIEAGAQVNVKPDWDAQAGTAAEILNKPSIPTVGDGTVTVTQDGQTLGTFNVNQSGNTTIDIPAGGSNAWYGTQAEFDALPTKDADTDYFISDKIDYNTDLKNTPDLSSYATKTEVNTKNAEQDSAIVGKMSAQFMTQQEFDALGQNIPEGKNFFIEGRTIEMVVTFTDQTTATYNIVVD